MAVAVLVLSPWLLELGSEPTGRVCSVRRIGRLTSRSIGMEQLVTRRLFAACCIALLRE
jgi:hypothetical protein